MDLEGQFSRFRSTLLGAEGKGLSAYADGKLIRFQSVQRTDGAEVDLNARGARRLELVAPGIVNATVFAWGRARLIR